MSHAHLEKTQLKVSQNSWYHFGGPYNQEYSILEAILRSPYFWKLTTTDLAFLAGAVQRGSFVFSSKFLNASGTLEDIPHKRTQHHMAFYAGPQKWASRFQKPC